MLKGILHQKKGGASTWEISKDLLTEGKDLSAGEGGGEGACGGKDMNSGKRIIKRNIVKEQSQNREGEKR